MPKPGPGAPPDHASGQLALPEVFVALSDPTRREILRLVEHRQRSVPELMGAVSLSEQVIQRHLSVLEDAGLIVDDRKGRVVRYRLNAYTLVRAMAAVLEQFAAVTNLITSRESLSRLGREEQPSSFNPDELIDVAANLAAFHPNLRGRAAELRSLLAWETSKSSIVQELAGGPRRILSPAELETELQVRIASEAISDIWQEDVLEPRQVALALGAKETNREKASSLRRRSQLLGIPRDSRYLYPSFQFDLHRRRLHPEVREVNEVLRAAEDPWGVASWWVSENDRLAARPVDLVGSRRSEEVVEAARAVVGPIG